MKKYNLIVTSVYSNSWYIDGSEIVIWSKNIRTNSIEYLCSRICSICPDGRLSNCKYNLKLNTTNVSFDDIYYILDFKKKTKSK